MSLNKKIGADYGYVSPSITKDAGKSVRRVFPTSEKVIPDLVDNSATINIDREITIIDLKGVSEDTTITLNADNKNLNIGARVVVRAVGQNQSDGCSVFVMKDEETIIGGTYLTVTVQSVMEFIWDGDRFLMVGEQEVPWEE